MTPSARNNDEVDVHRRSPPNFIKLAAVARAVAEYNTSNAPEGRTITHRIVHTGQHYDKKMSEGFFDDLGIPKPDINLEVGSGSHAVQTAEIMKRFEPVLLAEQPDVLLVVGDVNSTIAYTLVASKIEYGKNSAGLPPSRKRTVIVHVEAGLRSFDRDLPEEINRILTDAISDLLFITEQSGEDNLLHEGVAPEKIHFVGNVMIDTLRHPLHHPAPEHRTAHDRHRGYESFNRHRPQKIMRTVADVLAGSSKKGAVPKYWDGQAGKRIVDILASRCQD